MKKEEKKTAESGEAMGFVQKVVFTTCLTFTLITFFYLLVYGFVIQSHARMEQYANARYILGKLFCIFLFSLSLGFANRIPERKTGKALVLRLLRFAAALGSFILTLIVLFYSIPEGIKNLTVGGALRNLVLFLLFYFLTLGATALGRKVLHLGDKKEFKSILD